MKKTKLFGIAASAFLLMFTALFFACSDSSGGGGEVVGDTFDIELDFDDNQGTVTTNPADKAAEGATVTITVTPTGENTVKNGFPTVTKEGGGTVEVTPVSGETNKWTFPMPGVKVTVAVEFDVPGVPSTYTVTCPTNVTGGSVSANPSQDVEAGTTVTLNVIIEPNYALRAGFPKVTKNDNSGTVNLTPGENDTWTFIMPNVGVTVAVEFGISYHISTSGAGNNGSITVSEKAAEGDKIIFTVDPNEGYVVKPGFPTVTAGSDTITIKSTGVNEWYFVMPPAAVTITVEFKEALIPVVLEDFSAGSMTHTNDGGWWTGINNAKGPDSAQLTAAPGDGRGFGRRSPDVTSSDITGYDKISFGIWLQENGVLSPFTLKFQLETTEFGEQVDWLSPSFKIYPDELEGWQSIELYLSDFTNLGDKLSDETTIEVTGWAIWIEDGGFNLWISEITAESGAITPREVKQAVTIAINVEADFAGLPKTIALKKGDPELVLQLTGYTAASWYLDGEKDASALTGEYTLDPDELDAGPHSLTVVVKVGGYSYSKKIDFTVKE
ncbi:MAG: hypothetical protein LBB72_06475 [Spirochaetaceae bacterium]|jgi:hypothetical protein|nr:hypothetical protein [Spirochaetaceae bacterium]